MSLIRSDGKTDTRVDVVPVSPEVMDRFAPTFTLTPTPDEAGERAAAQLEAVLSEGKGGQIDQGLELTFTQLPPGLEHLVGERQSGTFIFSTPEVAVGPVPPWHARLTAGTDPATDPSVDVLLTPVEPPNDWDVSLSGATSGFTATVLMRKRDGRGQMTFNMHYARDNSPVREQLAVIEFLRHLGPARQLLLTDVGATARPPLNVAVPPQDESRLDQLEAFFRDVVTIEDWADVRFELPSDILVENVRTVAQLSEDIRQGGYDGTLRDFEVTATQAGAERLRAVGMKLAMEEELHARLFGQTFHVGYTYTVFDDYEVTSETPVAESDGDVLVRLGPRTPEGAQVHTKLSRTRLLPPSTPDTNQGMGAGG